ncbi:MotA/TolQ/ExbB proton channel family protein [Rasiella sp. SM2506]|uniref:MotA/TolQ/ExbB proton channel family protein n=1 Tax=Rasiella sp. SM2506 TaxID=3423914 RepID=UPI003D7A94E4
MRIPLNIISDGGPFFMIPLILFIFLLIILCIVAIRKVETREKYTKLISHVSLFALVWGFLGSTIGLIQGFDAIQSVDDMSNGMMAGGLKIALLTTLFGLITFLIGRFCMILITLKSK